MAEMKNIEKETRNYNDTSNYSKLRRFYDSIKSEDIWKVIILILIKLGLENYRKNSDNLFGANSDYIRKIQNGLPVICLGRSPEYEVTNMLSHVFSELSLSTKTIIQKTVNDLIFNNKMSIKVIDEILAWNRNGMVDILLPETLELIITDKKRPQITRWLALHAMLDCSNVNRFCSYQDIQKIKELCDGAGLTQLSYVALLKYSTEHRYDKIDFLTTVEDKHFRNAYPADVNSISSILITTICENGINVGLREIKSGAGLVNLKYKLCCPSMKKLISKCIVRLFEHNIIEKEGGYFITDNTGFRQLAIEEVAWLKELIP